MPERVRTKAASLLILLTAMTSFTILPVTVRSSQAQEFGPEVTEFLDFLRQEDEELEFQIARDEISRKDYVRAKNRIAVMRHTVIEIAQKSGKDIVPELHVVTASELTQVLDGGLKVIKGIKPGTVVEERWRYLGHATRGEVFYIFERIKKR